jgi:hypothetical protein
MMEYRRLYSTADSSARPKHKESLACRTFNRTAIQSILEKLPPNTLLAEFFNTEAELLLFLARADWSAPKINSVSQYKGTLQRHPPW